MAPKTSGPFFASPGFPPAAQTAAPRLLPAVEVLSYGHQLPAGSFGLAEVDGAAARAFCAGEAGAVWGRGDGL